MYVRRAASSPRIVYLIGPGGAIIADKTDEDGSGAHIQAELPEAGTYLVAVVGEFDSGGYVLSIYDADVGQG